MPQRQSLGSQGLLETAEDDAGLDHGVSILPSDGYDVSHVFEIDQYTVRIGHRPPHQAGSAAVGDKRHVCGFGPLHEGLHIRRATRAHHASGHDAEALAVTIAARWA
jgi:hypothetical protein